MGIPLYFRKIIERYPETHFWKNNMAVDNLFIDFNSMIYGVIPEIDIKLGSLEYENELITKIISKLRHLIVDVIKPTKMVYIAVDGTPPRAKMVQQKSRRYKSLKEQNFIYDLEKKYKITIPHSKWNRNSISPGTSFMIKLSKGIIKNIQSNDFNSVNSKLTIVFNDDSVPGEGEHKLLPNLRRLRGKNDVSVIYSPDADLIVLSIMSKIDNIYILREPKDSDIELKYYKDHEFLYLDIDSCKNKFYENLAINIDDGCKDRILLDYSVLTFLCGNDFVTAISFLKVKDGGIDILIDTYREIFNEINQFLVNESMSINYVFLLKLLKNLSSIEESSMKKQQRKIHRIRQGCKIQKEDLREPWEIEIMRFNHEEYYSPAHPHYDTFNKIFDRIDYYSPEWNNMYNKHFFQGIEIDDVCSAYIRSLNFCTRYYYSSVPSWSWYYPYRNAPSVKDLCAYLEKHIECLEKLDPPWELGTPYTQFEHLMTILPRQSFRLLPRCLDVDESLEKYYPKNFILDVVAGHKFIYSEIIVPDVPIELIRAKISKESSKFSFLEKERNTLRNRPFVHKG